MNESDKTISSAESVSGSNSVFGRYGIGINGIKLVIVLVLLAITGAVSFVAFGHCCYHLWSNDKLELGPGLGRQLRYYARDHEGRFPDSQNWCDILESEGYSNFGGRAGKEKACYYAINPTAARLGKKAPANMVLLFPAKRSWNLAGGAELVREDILLGRVPVLFADFRIRCYRGWEIPWLRWEPGDNGKIPQSGKKFSAWIAGIFLLSWLLFILIRYRRFIFNYRYGFVMMIIVAGVSGALLGLIIEKMFYCYHLSQPHSLGWLYGMNIGMLTELYFCGLFSSYHYKDQARQLPGRLRKASDRWLMISQCAILGLICGGLGSIVFNVLLMIAYGEQSFWPFFASLAFGCWAGVIMGITNGIIVGPAPGCKLPESVRFF